jgi:hypothetical protein
MSAKLKPCPACEAMIAKSATTCPQCGKSMTSASRILMLAIIAVLIVFFLGGGTYCSVIRQANRQLDQMEQRARSAR